MQEEKRTACYCWMRFAQILADWKPLLQEEKRKAAAILKAERDRQLAEQFEKKRAVEEAKRREDELLKKQDIKDMKVSRWHK